MIARRQALQDYALVLLATLCGIVGMGLTYTGVTDGNPGALVIGLPLLFAGLWWAGIHLGRSQTAARARRAARLRGRSPDRG